MSRSVKAEKDGRGWIIGSFPLSTCNPETASPLKVEFHCKAATQPARTMEDVWTGVHCLESMFCYIIISGRNVTSDGTAISKATCKKSATRNGMTPL